MTTHAKHSKARSTTLKWFTNVEFHTRIDVGQGTLGKVFDIIKQGTASKRVLLVCQNTTDTWTTRLEASLTNLAITKMILPDGEACKSLECLQSIWDELQKRCFLRQDTIVALGGGSLTDVAGFAASTYMRGLNLVLVPTTLLAQVDASIGGKTAINLPAGKNLAGTFFFPSAIIIDTACLSSLPENHFRSGLGEILKYALIEGTVAQHTEYRPGPRSLLELLEQNLNSAFSYKHSILEGAISSCIRMKLSVAGKDPLESGLRRCLNLGHTLAHAIETVSNFTVAHGEAVSIGLLFAARVAVARQRLDQGALERLSALATSAGLPLTLPAGINREAVVRALAHDKKRHGSEIKFVLPVNSLGLVDFEFSIPLGALAELI